MKILVQYSKRDDYDGEEIIREVREILGGCLQEQLDERFVERNAGAGKCMRKDGER